MSAPKPVYGFNDALTFLGNGHKVSRYSWADKTKFVALQRPTETSKMTKPYLYTSGADGIVPWTPSQDDILATDWLSFD